MFTDLPETELRTYRSDQVDPPDFDSFWASTLEATGEFPLDLTVTPLDSGLRTIDVFDVTFAGYRGQPVRAWLRLPAGIVKPRPAIVEFVGYGGGRGHAVENLFWASAGFAHFQMDTRGQGSIWSPGDTADPEGSPPSAPGLMTRGIESPETSRARRPSPTMTPTAKSAATWPCTAARPRPCRTPSPTSMESTSPSARRHRRGSPPH